MNIAGPFNSGAAVGGAGVAMSNADSPTRLNGYVVGVYVKYNDSPPAGTTKVTVSSKGASPRAPSLPILVVDNAATDAWFFPRVPTHLNSTGAAITDQYDWPPIDDFLNVKIEEANANDNVDVWLLMSEG